MSGTPLQKTSTKRLTFVGENVTIGLRIPLLPERYVVFRTGEEKRELGIEEEPCYFFFNRRIMYIIMQEINSQLHVVTQSIQPRRSILLSHGTGIDPDIMIERFLRHAPPCELWRQYE